MINIEKNDIIKFKKRVENIMLKIRQTTPCEPVNTNEAKGSETFEACLNGKPSRRIIIYLRSSGCEWVVGEKCGNEIAYKPGCFNCEHSILGTTFGDPISSDDYFTQFEDLYSKHNNEDDFKEHPIICVYNEGSFLNKRELPDDARNRILSLIADNEDIKAIILESLPQYITPEIIDELNVILKGKKIEIGIGLESSNDKIRNLCINKPYTLQQFKNAVSILKGKCDVLAYVLLKPSFLSEKEGIADAIKTCRYAFENGASVVSLEPVSIGTHTLPSYLYKEGLYEVPRLWSAIKVAKAVKTEFPDKQIRIGGFQFAPAYRHPSSNCPECNRRVLKAIANFNQFDDIRHLLNLDCSCKDDWKSDINKEDDNFEKRLVDALIALESKLSITRDEVVLSKTEQAFKNSHNRCTNKEVVTASGLHL